MTDVLMILKTLGIEYDDRVRKEALSLNSLGLEVKILVNEQSNQRHKGISKYGIKYRAIKLLTRAYLPHKKYLLLKLLEMYLIFAMGIIFNRPKILYLHNLEMLGLVYFANILKKIGFIKAIVWDQHELPSESQLNNLTFVKNFVNCVNRSDLVICANQDRVNFLINRFGFENKKFIFLENYVDIKFHSQEKLSINDDLKIWLEDSPYLFVSAGSQSGRYLRELIMSVFKVENLKIVIIGPRIEVVEKSLASELGEDFYKRVYFAGLIPLFEIVRYLDYAIASVIFYSTNILNLKYCAPNRLYQAISRGIPILTGDNPPLKRLVDEYSNGVAISNDGSDPEEILIGIKKLIKNIDNYKQAALNSKNKFVWESQMEKFKFIKDLIK